MVDTQKKMYEGQPGVGDTLLYTAPAGGAIVRGIDVTNNTALDATITLALNSDGALIDATKFFSDFVIESCRSPPLAQSPPEARRLSRNSPAPSPGNAVSL